MKWSEARARALESWESVRDSIGKVPVDDLVREINAMNELCDKAAEESHGCSRCEYCLAYDQFGGCSEITALMSHYAARKEYDKVRELAATFMERIQALDVKKES